MAVNSGITEGARLENYPSLKQHKLYTEQFWKEFGHQPLGRKGCSKRPKEETIRALIRLGEVRLYFSPKAYSPEKNRELYETKYKKQGKYRQFTRCFACRGQAQVRHHIIWIRNGGRNTKKNIVALCRPCHAEIHPWLII